MKRLGFLFITLFALTIVTGAQGLAVGSAVEDFSLPDLDGKVQALDKIKGRDGTVVIFLSAQCPGVKAYKDRINQIAAEAREKGINFIGVNSNSNEALNLVTSNAAQFGYRFPVLIDNGNRLADSLGARATPEVYFFNRENVLLYRGAIDNDRSGSNITDNYLAAAFDALLAGKPIPKKSIMPRGCPIKRGGM